MHLILKFIYDIHNFCSFQPKIQVASKYERRVDTRSYDDKKKLFEGVSKINYLKVTL